jgi:hypothetical protein
MPGMGAAFAACLLLAAVIPANNTQQPQLLGAFYFDVLDQSQVWMNLEPEEVEAGPPPVVLNVTVVFPGRKLVAAPDVVMVRAQANQLAFPTRLRQAVLHFRTGDGRQYDLTAPGRSYEFTASCEKCPLDTLTTRMAFEELREIAGASGVSVEALGFQLRLAPADLAALQRLVEAVQDGAVVK